MRDLSTDVSNALAESQLKAIFLIEIVFDSQPLRMCTATHEVSWDSKTWLGTNGLLAISDIEEDISLGINQVTLSIAITTANLAWALNRAVYYNKPVTIWMAPLDGSGVPVADPSIVFRGNISQVSISAGSSSVISAKCESIFASWRRIQKRMYTNEDHQAQYPGDTALTYVRDLLNKSIIWTGGNK